VQLQALAPDVRRTVEAVLERPGEGRPIAFDADGTLWRGDVGEELLRYLCSHQLLPQRSGDGVYEEYERKVERDPADAYAFAVEVMAGFDEGRLNALCADVFARRFLGRLFPFTRPLLAAVSARGYAPWIVSASPSWIIAAGAAALGVPTAQVIAVHAEVEDRRLTRHVHRPIPCGEGKVALLKGRGLAPVLAFGNGELDQPMLEYASAAVVVAPHGEGGNGLVRAAVQRRWPVQRG
jgi:phosphatidylglycerophosphatase C